MLALIIEDEPIAARTLQQQLMTLAPDITTEGPLATVSAALARLSTPPIPDLIFMDVQLSDGLCFEIFETKPLALPVIFTTAFDTFAVKAFDVFGIDYLLKPIKPERLALALAKWRRMKSTGAVATSPPSELAQTYLQSARQVRTRFLVQHGDALQSVAVGDVAYFHKDLVVRLVTSDSRAFTLAQSLDELEQVLVPGEFFRINRQVLARASAIEKATRQVKGRLDVQLKPPLKNPAVVSQERASDFRDWLDR